MKPIFFLVAVFGLTQFSCKKSSFSRPVPGSLEGKWRMISVKENLTGFTTTKLSSVEKDVDITFSANSNTSGIFLGNTPTNEIGANAYSIGTNQSLSIPALSMTKVIETSWGNEFVQNIRSSQEYSFEQSDRLDIKTTNRTLTFIKL